jgi:hypothetical protein
MHGLIPQPLEAACWNQQVRHISNCTAVPHLENQHLSIISNSQINQTTGSVPMGSNPLLSQ